MRLRLSSVRRRNTGTRTCTGSLPAATRRTDATVISFIDAFAARAWSCTTPAAIVRKAECVAGGRWPRLRSRTGRRKRAAARRARRCSGRRAHARSALPRPSCSARHWAKAWRTSPPPMRGARACANGSAAGLGAASGLLTVRAERKLRVRRASPPEWCISSPIATRPSVSVVKVTRHSGRVSVSGPASHPMSRGSVRVERATSSSSKRTWCFTSNDASGTQAGGVRPSGLRIRRSRAYGMPRVASSIQLAIPARSRRPSAPRRGAPSRIATPCMCIASNVAVVATYPSSQMRMNSAWARTRACAVIGPPSDSPRPFHDRIAAV